MSFPEVASREGQLVRAALSRHGHGFQFAVVNRLAQLRTDRKTAWAVEAVEFPFDVNGNSGHADIVLRAEGAVSVVECKKVRKGLSMWCFARSNLVSRGHHNGARTVTLEGVVRLNEDPKLNACLRPGRDTERQYNVFVELKDGEGEKCGSGRGALNEAVTQVLRGAAGILRAFISHPSLLPGQRGTRMTIVPVIITNARLMLCNTDLALTDLASGTLPERLSIEEASWLWLRAMASHDVRHEFWPVGARACASFGDLQDQNYARSIAITTPEGLVECLNGIHFHVQHAE